MILGLVVNVILGSLRRNLFQFENMHGFRVGAAAQELGASTKRQRGNRYASLHASSEFKQLVAIAHAKHTNHGALLAGRGDLRSRLIESDGRQRRFVRRNHRLRMQIDGVEYLHFAGSCAAWIGKEAVVRIRGQSTQSGCVWRCVAYGVHHFHIADVVNVERLFEAYDQTGTIEFDGQNCVRIRVVAYFRSLFEVTYLYRMMPGNVYSAFFARRLRANMN